MLVTLANRNPSLFFALICFTHGPGPTSAGSAVASAYKSTGPPDLRTTAGRRHGNRNTARDRVAGARPAAITHTHTHTHTHTLGTGPVVQAKRYPFAPRYFALALYRALFAINCYSTAALLFPIIISWLDLPRSHGPCPLPLACLRS